MSTATRSYQLQNIGLYPVRSLQPVSPPLSNPIDLGTLQDTKRIRASGTVARSKNSVVSYTFISTDSQSIGVSLRDRSNRITQLRFRLFDNTTNRRLPFDAASQNNNIFSARIKIDSSSYTLRISKVNPKKVGSFQYNLIINPGLV